VRGKVFLINHSEYAVCAEIVRMFFGSCRREDNHLLFPLDSCLRARIGKSEVNIFVAVNPPIPAQTLTALRTKSYFCESELAPIIEIKIAVRAERTYETKISSNLVDLRRNLKKALYRCLSVWTSIRFPWGSLTGVRPTQICAEQMRKLGPSQAKRELVQAWGLAPDKADLGLEVAAAEMNIISTCGTHNYIVYCGLPFCPTRCSYCSFTTEDAVKHKDKLGEYVDAIIAEAKMVFANWRGGDAVAIYFGGGTPTSLLPNLFARYVEGLLSVIPHNADTELTMEAGRPDTLDREMLSLIKQAGFNRLCVNPQTMHDKTLRRIGRKHSVRDTLVAFQLARDLGFASINMDLIYGLPGEEVSAFVKSLTSVLSLAPESITLHSLALKHSTRLLEETDFRTLLAAMRPDQSLQEELEQAYGMLRQQGYRPYYLYKQKRSRGSLENTGFALSGHESLYNVLMMSDRFFVIGLGSGSTSKFLSATGLERQHNSKDLSDYIARVEEFARKKLEYLSRAFD